MLSVADWPAEISVAYLRDEYARTKKEDLDPAFEEENAEAREWSRSLLQEAVNAKLEPTVGTRDSLLEALPQDFRDNRLDEYFTLQGLATVGKMVRRWKKLRAVEVSLLPGKLIRSYLRQARDCYLRGMYDAAAVLCRATLEFALRGKLSEVNGESSADLTKLIDYARQTTVGGKPILPIVLADRAHEIRKAGNDALHDAIHDRPSVSEPRALELIEHTGHIVGHLCGGG